MKILQRELCRLILGSFGLVPPPNFGKVGITTSEFRIDKTILLEIEDAEGIKRTEEFGLWCGSVGYQASRLRVLATDICDNEKNYHEFIATYVLEDSTIHGIKAIYGEDHNGLFVVKGNSVENDGSFIKGVWKPVGRYEMLIASAGFERIKDLGLTWNTCNEWEDLYNALIEVIDLE